MVWGRGRTRPGTIGCGFALLLASLVATAMGLRAWLSGDPASDYLLVGGIAAVVSLIFVGIGWRMQRRPLS